MKILLTGANGMLAKSVIKRMQGEDIISTDVEELDITNLDKVLQTVEKERPDYIINCAAYTSVDEAESNYDLAYKINTLGPKNLAIAANRYDLCLIHISTDYVFSGNLELDKVYKEEDMANPETVYGKTKLLGEQEIKANTNKYYIFRTAWLFGDGKNFVRTMINLGNSKAEINVVKDQYGSPTNADDLADIIYSAIKNKIPFGIYHATNLGYANWYEFAKKIFEILNIKCKVNPVSTEEYKKLFGESKAKRPLNSKLSKEKILKENIKISNWEDALERYLKN